jgi:hypothetical protein
MKKAFYIFLLILFSKQLSGQTSTSSNKLVGTKWESNWIGFGEGFKMEYSDSIITISNAPNIYSQFKFYKLKNDTLIIGGITPLDKKKLSKPLNNYPTFKVNKIDKDSLIMTALNWQAVYITGTLTSPYTDVDYNEFIKLDKTLKPSTDFSQGGAVNDHLDMFKQK